MSVAAHRRLVVIWLTTLAFLPLYVASGVILRDRVAAGAYGTDAPGALIGAVGVLLAAVALGLRPLGRKVGLAGGPATLLAWAGAEGVAICALAWWVGGGATVGLVTGLTASAALLIVLRPRRAGGPA